MKSTTVKKAMLFSIARKVLLYIRIRLNRSRNRKYQKLHFNDANELTKQHFNFWSNSTHLNYISFQIVLNALTKEPAKIIETGTSAWGTDSTRIWDSYIRKYGGELWTVDIRKEASERLSGQLSEKSTCVVSDSIDFLNSQEARQANIYFLDSWDVDWTNPYPAAKHGLREFEAIETDLRTGTILFIDDTPKSSAFFPGAGHEAIKDFEEKFGVFPGKGSLAILALQKNFEFEVLHHEYSFVARIC